MSNPVSWPTVVIAVVVAVFLVYLIGWARGPKHYRGDELGSHGKKVVVVIRPPA